MSPLTDLEGAVLADFARLGQATSYTVAKTLADSPSEFWSGSAGAVYPLVKRMETRGLLAASSGSDGRRARTDYALTAAGRVALKRWLLDSARAAGLGFDPLRTRLAYLDLATPKERETFLRQVRAHIDALAEKEAWPAQPRLQKIHATWMKARKAWLKSLDFLVA